VNLAETGIKESAQEEKTAITSTFAKYVSKKDTSAISARAKALRQVLDNRAKRPSWVRGLMWNDIDLGISRAALWTENASPLPSVPIDEFRNVEAIDTIFKNPDLFKIVTPIKISRFKELLSSHPNQPFVDSVIYGLSHGFWPFAHTRYGVYPTTVNDSGAPPKTIEQADFLRKQIQTESDADRYSPPFGPQLLPGMYCTPILAVPRKGKLRLCNHHSHGEFALNSMIKRDDIAGVKLDGIRELGESLRLFRHQHGDEPLVIFKSDVKAAYRRMPLHYLWQIKQVLSFEGLYRVDRVACFGSRSSQIIFMAFMSLVTWIAIYVYLIAHLKDYVDDVFSFERADRVLYYPPYQTHYPAKQTRLLLLWDELGIPHDKEKQEFGPTLRVIGLDIDPNAMTVSMDIDSRNELIQLIRTFAVAGKKRTLKEFQRVAGHVNWALNVFPLLKPGLSAVYSKTAGKDRDLASIRVNSVVVYELSWVTRRIISSSGVHFLKSVEWDPRSAESHALSAFTDASGIGLGFFIPCLKLAFQCRLPSVSASEHIFFFEALAVCSVFHYFAKIIPSRNCRRLVVYSDSTNTVDIFNSLHASAPHNLILMSAMNVVLDHEIDYGVIHVRGVDNPIADAVSRFKNDLAVSLCPGLVIRSFEPPQDALGAVSG
jgi:hypothetical protein